MSKQPAYIDTQNFGLDDLFFLDRLTMTKHFPLHRHSFVELHLFTGGQGIETINGITHLLQPGSFTLKMPWHVHEILPHTEKPLNICKVSFRMGNLEEGGLLYSVAEALAQNYKYEPVVTLNLEERLFAEGLFQQMLNEKKQSLTYKKEMLAAQITQLLVLFIRHMSPGEWSDHGLEKPQTAEKIIQLMNHRYREHDLTCKDIAQAIHYSETQVGRLIQEYVGLNFGELLREIRIRNACSLLQNFDHTVDAIAGWVGYRSRSAFYTAFQELKGISPAEFRKQRSVLGAESVSNLTSGSKIYTQVIYYLHKHYAEELTPELLAGHFHYNSAYLAKLLAEQGTSFKELLNETRIYHSKQLLLFSEHTIPAISRMVGYTSPETFYRVFKKMAGCTPNAYKEQQKHP